MKEVLKKRLIDHGFHETVTNGNALKMKAADGKMRLTIELSEKIGQLKIKATGNY